MKQSLFFSLITLLLCACAPARSMQDSTKKESLQIVDAKLGKEVQDRMITGEDSVFAKGAKVFFWMKLTGGASSEITVTWRSGDFTHNTTLTIGGSPWRTWASKTLHKTGEWSVSVTDSQGTVLKEVHFKVE